MRLGVGARKDKTSPRVTALAVAARTALRFCAQTGTSALSASKFRQHRYVSVNISLIPLAETGINASLAAVLTDE
jgi:hypothetical protein